MCVWSWISSKHVKWEGKWHIRIWLLVFGELSSSVYLCIACWFNFSGSFVSSILTTPGWVSASPKRWKVTSYRLKSWVCSFRPSSSPIYSPWDLGKYVKISTMDPFHENMLITFTHSYRPCWLENAIEMCNKQTLNRVCVTQQLAVYKTSRSFLIFANQNVNVHTLCAQSERVMRKRCLAIGPLQSCHFKTKVHVEEQTMAAKLFTNKSQSWTNVSKIMLINKLINNFH